jgi:hypothetical protein
VAALAILTDVVKLTLVNPKLRGQGLGAGGTKDDRWIAIARL